MFASKIVPLPLVVTTVVGLAACSDGTGPSGSSAVPGFGSVTLSLSTGNGGPSAAAPESVSVGGHTIVLGKVEVVLREIRLKRVQDSCDCRDDSGSSGSGAPGPSGESSDDDDCEKFVAGPLLLDLPLGGGVKRMVSVEVDSGTYRRLEFRIHKPEDDAGDDAFIKAHPDFDRVSIRATGTYDGRAFIYISDLNARQRSDLVPPLVVSGTKATDLTLMVDVQRWFVDGQGGLVDPQSGLKGQRNENLVRDNIRRSFRFFKDEDRDGKDDR